MLERIAEDRGLSLNSLIASTLHKFVEWDSQIDSFGHVTLPHELFSELLYADSTKEIEEVGRSLGPRLVREMLQFWFKRVNMGAFIEYLNLTSKHSGVSRGEFQSKSDECVLAYRHRLGERWSRFISAFYGEALKQLFAVEAKAEVGPNQIILRWKPSDFIERSRY